MTTRVPERLIWAADLLDINSSDRVLEIGCGSGVLAELICTRLCEGRLVAIDRSAAMIAAATKRNRQNISDGRARFLPVTLKDAPLAGERFDKAVAVNVNIFWQRPEKELAALHALLAPKAVFYLVYEPPTGDKAQQIAAQVRHNLESNGFSVRSVSFRDLKPGSAVCITAQERSQGS
ncbi:MAG TPA: class I SAM-dependent methyltransferase [Thermoanaerobaculia bacterium]|nr:class I SAM-dependent methyltransferase [Thermoanaerobaculia bacterium]